MVGRGAISPRPDRRAFLTAAGILLAAGLPLRADSAPRLAAIDWAMMETATALGHMPVAAAELIRFRADVGVPAIPDTVTDLGLRGAPNFELLQLSPPDADPQLSLLHPLSGADGGDRPGPVPALLPAG